MLAIPTFYFPPSLRSLSQPAYPKSCVSESSCPNSHTRILRSEFSYPNPHIRTHSNDSIPSHHLIRLRVDIYANTISPLFVASSASSYPNPPIRIPISEPIMSPCINICKYGLIVFPYFFPSLNLGGGVWDDRGYISSAARKSGSHPSTAS